MSLILHRKSVHKGPILASKLELLNEQFAKRSERNRKIWRTVFIVIGVFALIGIIKQILLLINLYQFQNVMNSTAAMIGGADEAASIFVSDISFNAISAIATFIAAIGAAVGIHHTKRK